MRSPIACSAAVLAALALVCVGASGATAREWSRSRPVEALSGAKYPGFAADGVTPVLGMDQAGVRFANNLTATPTDWVVAVHYQTDLCYGCTDIPALLFSLLPVLAFAGAGPTPYAPFDTAFGTTLYLYDASSAAGANGTAFGGPPFHSSHHQFGEGGLYTVQLSGTPNTASFALVIVEERAPSSTTYKPIMVAGVLFLVLALAVPVAFMCYRRISEVSADKPGAGKEYDDPLAEPIRSAGGAGAGQRASDAHAQHKDAAIDEPAFDHASKRLEKAKARDANASGGSNRVTSVDTFRGFALCIMIFVNYGGGGYWFFNHSAWNGVTVADLVFPWFIFLMGTSMAISFESQSRHNIPKRTQFVKIVRRTCILFGLGLLVSNAMQAPETLRIPGVLQRFAVSYFVVATVMLVMPRFVPSDMEMHDRSAMSDVTEHIFEWIAIVALVVVHTCLTFLLDVPGCGRGYLGPGGPLVDGGQRRNCTGGAAGYIDREFLGTAHMYQTPTCHVAYQTGPYDPEGTLGCLTSIFMTYLGVACGRVIVYYDGALERCKRWLVWAALLGAFATGLCGGAQNGGAIPLNKNMWSLSFVSAMAAFAFVALTLCYVLVDVLRVWSGAPFVYPGKNSIAVYCASEILSERFPFFWRPAADTDGHVVYTHAFMMLQNVVATALFVLMSFWMHEEKIFVKI